MVLFMTVRSVSLRLGYRYGRTLWTTKFHTNANQELARPNRLKVNFQITMYNIFKLII